VTSNIFIAEVAGDGSIPFVTYDGVGIGSGIAVDSSGIYITGEAFPPDSDVDDFPFGDDAGDLFVQKLSVNGSPGYFTFADEPDEDLGNGIALDDLHNAWAVGASFAAGGEDALVIEVAPDGERIYKRRFSSTGDDVAFGVAVAARQPWITGKTCGDGFPATDGFLHHQTHCAVFVLQLDVAGNQNMAMIFGGVDGDDAGVAIVTNGSNDAFVTGFANSTFFPITIGNTIGTFIYPRGFVTEVSPVVSPSSVGKIVHSTLFDVPDGFVRPYAIANDNRGGLYIAGATSSQSFPAATSAGPPSSTIGFVSKISPDISQTGRNGLDD
jgi:hypothetical protein